VPTVTVSLFLAVIAGLLFLLAIIPQTREWPLVAIGGLLLAIAFVAAGLPK
jgi:hypothetical protein